MEDIKFRAWNDGKTRTRWLRPDEFALTASGELLYRGDDKEWGVEPWEQVWYRNGLYEVKLMQYTGLKDKNGKEIYEGDIINITITHDDPYEGNISRIFRAIISFQHGGFWFTGIDFNLTDCNWHFYNESDIEVIGNMYENPELVANENL